MKEHIRCRKCKLALTCEDSIADGRCYGCRMRSPKKRQQPAPVDDLKAQLDKEMQIIDSIFKSVQKPVVPPPSLKSDTDLKMAEERLIRTRRRLRMRIYIEPRNLMIGAHWDNRRKTGLNIWFCPLPFITIQIVIPKKPA